MTSNRAIKFNKQSCTEYIYMQAVILTGIFAGFVHVVSGADHLIAMAPAAINNPQKALKNSFSWGLGHSSGVLC